MTSPVCPGCGAEVLDFGELNSDGTWRHMQCSLHSDVSDRVRDLPILRRENLPQSDHAKFTAGITAGVCLVLAIKLLSLFIRTFWSSDN